MRCTPAILACLLLVPTLASGQRASLVLDINQTPEYDPRSPYGSFSALRAAGTKLFFLGGDTLWVSDGTAARTKTLPGTGITKLLASLGNLVLWARGTNGIIQLWRSDGTRPGTFPLTGPDVDAFSSPGYTGEPGSAAFRGSFYFPACSHAAPADCDLWRTDGTVGTQKVHQAEGAPGWIVASGERLFYLSRGPQGVDLWVTDGTPARTVLLYRFGAGVATRSPVLAGGRLFFVATSDGEEVWSSDGTPAGTQPLTQFPDAAPFGYADWLAPMGNRVYFVANDGLHGREIWRSDGTPAGTIRVTDLAHESPFQDDQPTFLAEAGGKLVFLALAGEFFGLWTTQGAPASTALLFPAVCSGCRFFSELAGSGDKVFFALTGGMEELWISDGTASGTRKIRDLCQDCSSGALQPWHGGVLFLLYGQFWFSDGTDAGTGPLTDLEDAVVPQEFPLEVAELDGKLYFLAKTVDGGGLWVRDTSGGTHPVFYYLPRAASSAPSRLASYRGRLFFTANDSRGQDLWSSTGTAESTGSLGLPAGLVSWPDASEFIPFADLLFFVTGGPDGPHDLWRTDGTLPGTFQLAQVAGKPVPVLFGGALYFFDGREIWKTDGTLQGTVKNGELPAEVWGVEQATAGANGLYLKTVDDPYQTEFWFTDGTSAGSRQITDLHLSGVGGGEIEFAALGPLMYFSWDSRLWKSDGTLAGTGPTDLFAGLPPGDYPFRLTSHQGKLYVFTTNLSGHPEPRLWRTDGTAAETVLLAKFPFQDVFYPPIKLQPFGERLFFTMSDGVHGKELWATDGTPGGTGMVADILPGPDSSGAIHLTAAGGRLFFAALDELHGGELWESDGTAAGTRMVQDIAPQSASSYPADLTQVGDKLFFAADDGIRGRELWVVPLAAPPGCKPTSARLCLNGGRYAVEAIWRDFQGNRGAGHAVSLTSDTGYFWFFNQENVEVVLKVLDGHGVNGHVWVFYGALSTVEYTLTVTDTQTGLARRYINPMGQLASVGDTESFGPLGAASRTGGSPAPQVKRSTVAAAGICEPSPTRLCLNGDRFAVEATWKDFQGNAGVGKAVELTPDTGYFWFFDQENVEVVLKVLNGVPVNGYHWVFYGALSSVEYTLTVTDTVTGAKNTYKNPSGSMASVADTGAFIQ